jgi:hypothetical protein
MSDMPFWQAAILQAIGPSITVSIGGFLAALFTARIQQQREDQQLRRDLIDSMAATASALYLATQQYWRIKMSLPAASELQIARSLLDEKYQENRVRGEVLETRLGGTFRTTGAKRYWHGVTDLLTVRYFQLIDKATDGLLRANAGPEHSGLSVDELRNPKSVLDAYHQRLDQAIKAVRTDPLAYEQTPGGLLERIFRRFRTGARAGA